MSGGDVRTETHAEGLETVEETGRLSQQLSDARAQLAAAQETLRAIRSGEIDALVVSRASGEERVFSIASADRPYRSFVENMSDGAATVSPDGIVVYANHALAALVTSSYDHIVGRPVLELFDPDSRSRLGEVLAVAAPPASTEAGLITSRGTTLPVLIGSSSVHMNGEPMTCLTFTDLTNERQAKADLAHSALHDELTGLPNRTLLRDRIQHALERRDMDDELTALMFCDVDGFKNVNDAYGHAVGDETLCTIAARLVGAVRPEDTVARIGGDEFIVFAERVHDAGVATEIAARLRESIGEPIPCGSVTVEATVSIGVAVARIGDLSSPDTLLRDADEAMYKAKRQGPSGIRIFDDGLREVAESRLRLLTELRNAVGEGQFQLNYQPILNLRDESVAGVEALIRWHHPDRGLVSPDEFIPFAESSGLITSIGSWVLREACVAAAQWRSADPLMAHLDVSVNVSARQLAQSAGLVQSLIWALRESGLDPSAVVLEVTESALMEDVSAAMRILNQLKDLGVRLAIDDFGTGFSSLTYLKRFPVDMLKVDRSFVSGMGLNAGDTAIVRSVIELASAFGIQAVAEGIETPQQFDALRSLGCAFGQGFLWSPAVPGADLVRQCLEPAPWRAGRAHADQRHTVSLGG